MKVKFFLIILSILLLFPFVSSAHYLTGYVNDALDGTLADGHKVVVWNPSVGISDNITDTIGILGNSNTEKMYLVDCELLNNPCRVGDNLSISVYDTGDSYVSTKDVFVNITGAGFDFVENLTMNSPIIFNSIVVDDSLNFTLNEIDLLTGTTREVTCEAVVEDLDGATFGAFYSEFFSEVSSNYLSFDDNNHHYTNSSCFVDTSYGNENQSYISCRYDIWYYSNSENWKCVIEGGDGRVNSTGEDTTFINPLLSIELGDSVDFGRTNVQNLSEESEVLVYNKGNVQLDLALSGYGSSIEDGLAMSCPLGGDIPIENKKYNLTSSNSGPLDLSDTFSIYTNLTSYPVIHDFNLDFRKNDSVDLAYNSTFWRIYVPSSSRGDCSGNIVFGAVAST